MSTGDPLSFGHIRLSNRPLIVCDIDEVVLEFLTPFRNFLLSDGRDLLPRSFRLHGNVVLRDSGEQVADEVLDALLEEFFIRQEEWQTPAERAVETLESLGKDADIVFLTAMPPHHETIRRNLLDRLDLHYPLLATKSPKGPVVRSLHDDRTLPLAFVDDIARNLHSVRESAPQCLLVHLMANEDFRPFAPDPGEGVLKATDWDDAARLIRSHISL